MARDAQGHWLPGTSGCPGGKGRELDEVHRLARAQTADSIRVLAKIRDDSRAPAQARVAASQALLDRGWGKPQQSVEAVITEKFAFIFPAPIEDEEEWLALPPPDPAPVQ